MKTLNFLHYYYQHYWFRHHHRRLLRITLCYFFFSFYSNTVFFLKLNAPRPEYSCRINFFVIEKEEKTKQFGRKNKIWSVSCIQDSQWTGVNKQTSLPAAFLSTFWVKIFAITFVSFPSFLFSLFLRTNKETKKRIFQLLLELLQTLASIQKSLLFNYFIVAFVILRTR